MPTQLERTGSDALTKEHCFQLKILVGMQTYIFMEMFQSFQSLSMAINITFLINCVNVQDSCTWSHKLFSGLTQHLLLLLLCVIASHCSHFHAVIRFKDVRAHCLCASLLRT